MSKFVVDASVAVKWFLTESDTPAAMALFSGSDDLMGPELLAVETAAAIVRRFRIGGIDEAQAVSKLAQARQVLSIRSIALSPDMGHLPRAEAMAIHIKHTLQDCLYLACAEAAGAHLITADAVLAARAGAAFPFVKML